MKQILVIEFERTELIEKIRRKYLPYSNRIEPHVTLVYPFTIDNQNELSKHISNSLKKFKPFKVKFRGIQKSVNDFFLYLLVEEGKNIIIDLHNRLNGGILKDFRNQDMPIYIPHISIGKFESKNEIDNAIKEISKLNISYETFVDKIQLLTIDNKHNLESRKNIKL